MSVQALENSTCVQGNVYGIALYAGQAAFGTEGPLPAATVVFIKPRNTYLASGGTVSLAEDLAGVEASAVLGLVFGRDACSVPAADAFRYVRGCVLGIDLEERGAGLLRVNVRAKCRDGFLPIGPRVVAMEDLPPVQTLQVQLAMNGAVVGQVAMPSPEQMAEAIREITSCTTLRAGDVLLVARMPLPAAVKAGDTLAAVCAEIGRTECTLAAEVAA